jgi:hypothetical protein
MMETALDVIRSLIAGAGPYVRIVIPACVVILLVAMPLAAVVHRFRGTRDETDGEDSGRYPVDAGRVKPPAGPGASSFRAAVIAVALFLANWAAMAVLKDWDAVPDSVVIVVFAGLAVFSVAFAVIAAADLVRFWVASGRGPRS